MDEPQVLLALAGVLLAISVGVAYILRASQLLWPVAGTMMFIALIVIIGIFKGIIK